MLTHNYIQVKVTSKQQLTDDVVGLTLVPVSRDSLSAWLPGAHIELSLVCSEAKGSDDEGAILRQYSLCGDFNDTRQWEIAVLREDNGRGGSLFIHHQIQVGDQLAVSEPHNHFRFISRKRCLFIAGGIGITPILPMIQQADVEGIDWRLVYLSRERNRMSCLDKLANYDQSRITLHIDAEEGFINLPELLASCDAKTSVYSCGPQPLLNALEEQHTQQSVWSLDIERFSGDPVDISGNSFDVVINSTGQRLTIPDGQSILSVLRGVGIKVSSSCCDGVCGTCEVGVLSGTPDHRDSILSEEERSDNDCMMLCVSRSHSPELILDL